MKGVAEPHPAGGCLGEVGRRDGRRHPVILVPLLGALGIAAVERIAVAMAGTQEPVVVLAATLGARVRAALLERGLGYLDLAGNCHLELDGGNFTLHVEGRRPAARIVGAGGLRAAGYRVLFSLLADPRLLERTVRDIGAVANASRHAVQSLLARLRDEGVVSRVGRSKHDFLPGGREKAIDRFSVGWADVLRGGLSIGRFRMREQDSQAATDTLVKGLAAANVRFGFGGAQGASRWLRYLQSDELTIHVTSWDHEVARRLGAVPDRGGSLHVFSTMTQLDLESGAPDTAHPLLVHAELARSPEPRARDAARLLLDRIAVEAR